MVARCRNIRSRKTAGPAPQTEVITLSDAGDVLFDFDKSDLTPAAKAQLDTLMDKLRNADVVSIKVIGHTDSKGSDAYNQALSERRASSVAAYLLSQGWRRTNSPVKGVARVSRWRITQPTKGARKTVAWSCTSIVRRCL